MREEPQRQPDASGFSLSQAERSDVAEKLPPRAAVLHETIRTQGEEELSRPVAALAWSALAAGLSMGFSMMARALLQAHLPDAPWRYVVENLGYSVGFLIVILARQQLFTENTMTAVLPLMTKPSLSKLGQLLRLWSVVMLGNLVGVALFAYGMTHMPLFDAPVQQAMAEIGREVIQNSPAQMFGKGLMAGWLIAIMVWLLPAAEAAKVAVIVIITYLISLAGFTHIVVGSTEVLYLLFRGEVDLGQYVVDFALPTLAGNIVGGSFIFALISHAQVRSDED